MAMRFERLDLNLLVALDALLTERSVSLAAERICLSQSATSSALGRLREYFGDDLLVLKGRQMMLTARGEDLVEPVRNVLDQIRATISVTPPFDPLTSDRTITIMASDYLTEVLLAPAMLDMATTAPNMRFEIRAMSDAIVETLERGTVDLIISIDYAISADHPSAILFEEDHVVAGWSGNPAMEQPMTKELFFELGHVTARFGKGSVPSFEDWFLRRQSQKRKIEVIAPTFMSVPGLLIGSKRIATMHRRMAMRLAEYLPLTVHPVPFDMPPIREAAQWHITNNNDPAIRWVVERLSFIAKETPSIANKDNVYSFGSEPHKSVMSAETLREYKAENTPQRV
jgi:DNA-binding transcriptional LysR family regulator